MPSPEFRLIADYFSRNPQHSLLGVGDDAALIAPTPGMALAVTTDTLVVDRHFFADANAYRLGWKSLAVNLSDLAAMGALPKWMTLAISMPAIDHLWLADYARGLFACAGQFSVDLVGGDTTRGALSITIQAIGEVPANLALTRAGARAGDDIWVSGSLGGAALALHAVQQQQEISAALQTALELPQPRVELGLALRGLAHSAIDLSDGLLADLGHVLRASGTGAMLERDALPAHPELLPHLHHPWAQRCLVAGGDDYELCFTAPPYHADEIAQLDFPLTRIGSITSQPGLHVMDSSQHPCLFPWSGYDHFA